MKNSSSVSVNKADPYRWIVLAAFMLMIAANQVMWITFAPITSDAMQYYQASDLQIGMLSMIFMIVYLVASIPASMIIDKYGIRTGVGTGAILTGAFGMMRGLVADSYTLVLIAQIGIAVGQPFLLNAITKVAARWFPINERATAAGMGTLSMYVGILAGMLITPFLAEGKSIPFTLLLYGSVSLVAVIVFFLLVRERPAKPSSGMENEERALVTDGLRMIFRNKQFNRLMIIFFICLGVFNAVTTWIEQILAPNGFSPIQSGLTGGLMIIGGIIGAIIMPALSDKLKKRIPFILIGLAGSSISLIGIAFSGNYLLLLVSGACFGFFLLSAGPIGFQYGAEITYPISEGTSNGFLILMGQASGILFILGMDMFKSSETGLMTNPLLVLIILMVASFFIAFSMRESDFIIESSSK